MKRTKQMGMALLLSTAMLLCSCGGNRQEAGSSGMKQSTKTESAGVAEGQSKDEVADVLGKTLIPDEERDYYQNYFAKKYDKVRRDNLSDWKDSEGNWCYPKGYEIQWKPSDDEVMAAQQFPQELLKDISTEELYNLIQKAHGSWSQSAFDSYAQALSYYYCRYDFIAELMRRKDCAEVIHKCYENTSADDKKLYSKTAGRQFSDQKTLEKQEQFQLLEGLEWFFLFKEGKSVPDDLTFGQQLISTNKSEDLSENDTASVSDNTSK